MHGGVFADNEVVAELHADDVWVDKELAGRPSRDRLGWLPSAVPREPAPPAQAPL